MRVAVTGTPGTGKTTATELSESGLEVVHLNDLVREEGLVAGEDEKRGTLIADLEAIGERLAGRDDVILESHLAHRLEVDRVIVLRCHPAELERRLRERGSGERDPDAYATENAESEALDLLLSEAVAEHGVENVYEIDTTDRSPAAVAREIDAAVAGERAPAAGEVDFTDYL